MEKLLLALKEPDHEHRYLKKIKKEKLLTIFNRKLPQPPPLPKFNKPDGFRTMQKHSSMETLHHLLSSRSPRPTSTRLFEKKETSAPKHSSARSNIKIFSRESAKTSRVILPKPQSRYSKQQTGMSSDRSFGVHDFVSGRNSLEVSSHSISPSPKKSKFLSPMPPMIVHEGESVYSALFSTDFFEESVPNRDIRVMCEYEAMKALIEREQIELNFLKNLVLANESDFEQEDPFFQSSLKLYSSLNSLSISEQILHDLDESFLYKAQLINFQNKLIKLLVSENEQFDLLFQTHVELLIQESKRNLANLGTKWATNTNGFMTSRRKPSNSFKPFSTLANEVEQPPSNPPPPQKKEENSESPKSVNVKELRKAYVVKINRLDSVEKVPPKPETVEENKSVEMNMSDMNSQLCSIRLRQNTHIPDSVQNNVDRKYILSRKRFPNESASRVSLPSS